MTMLSVILVEDDKDLSDITADHLRLRGVEVEQVFSGLEFYAALQKAEFDAAIIDLGLPDQPGAVLIKYASANTDMAVVVVSAYDQTEKRISCYEAGADTFLSKPVDPEELYVALYGLARKSKGRARRDVDASEFPDIQIASDHQDVAGIDHEKWLLDTLRRQLVAPSGVSVDLNHNEFKLCYRLAMQNGDVVGRPQMLESIYKRDDESAQRALDTLVRRLRKKISEDTDGRSPIMTTYGVGHSFTDHIEIVR
jgi:DNA-binding response OmpR family regulator